MARTDLRMLQALTDPDNAHRLQDNERDAFTDMLSRLENGRVSKLSDKQRQWVEGVYLKLELDAEEASQNLVSSGKVANKSTKVFPFELMPRPLKPPGRK